MKEEDAKRLYAKFFDKKNFKGIDLPWNSYRSNREFIKKAFPKKYEEMKKKERVNATKYNLLKKLKSV